MPTISNVSDKKLDNEMWLCDKTNSAQIENIQHKTTGTPQNHHKNASSDKVDSCEHEMFDQHRSSNSNSRLTDISRSTGVTVDLCDVSMADKQEVSNREDLRRKGINSSKKHRRKLNYNESELVEKNNNRSMKTRNKLFLKTHKKDSSQTSESKETDLNNFKLVCDEELHVPDESTLTIISADGLEMHESSNLIASTDYTKTISEDVISPSRYGIKLKLSNAKTLVEDSDDYGAISKSSQVSSVAGDDTITCPVVDNTTTSQINSSRCKNKRRKKHKMLDSIMDDLNDTLSLEDDTHKQRSTNWRPNIFEKMTEMTPNHQTDPLGKSKHMTCVTKSTVCKEKDSNDEKPKKKFQFKQRLKLGKRKLDTTEGCESNNSGLNIPQTSISQSCSENLIPFDMDTQVQSHSNNKEEKVTSTKTTRKINKVTNTAQDCISEPPSPELPCLSQYLHYSAGGTTIQEPQATITDVEVEDIFSDCYIQEELSDPVIIKIEDCEADKMQEEISQIK